MLRSAFSTSPHHEISRQPSFHGSSIDNHLNQGSTGNSFDERPIVGREFYSERSRQRTPSEGFQTHRFQVSPTNFHVNPIEERTPVKMRATSSHSFPSDLNNILQQASNSRLLHKENEIIFANDFSQKTFQPPATRKVAKVASKENYSLSNGKTRSSSATTMMDTQIKEPEVPRAKSIRRHQTVTHAGAGLITTESWKTDPVKHKTVVKKRNAAKPDVKLISEKKPERKVSPSRETKIVEKPTKPKVAPVLDQNVEKKKLKPQKSQPKVELEKQKSESKPKPPVMSEEEKLKLAEYMASKRLKREEQINQEKRLKIEEENKRREKLKKLSEQTKKVAQQPLPEHLIKKRSASARSSNGNPTEERRQRMLDLLGPSVVPEAPRERHTNTPFVEPLEIRERSTSRSSSSSESVEEIQSPKPVHPPSTVVLGLEVPVAPVEERQQKILRWAMSLARDCNVIEDKIKFSRPDGTQRFDVVAPTHQSLQSDQGNLRLQPPIEFVHREIPQKKKSNPKILRPSGRLSHLNQNQTSEYQDKDLPGIGNLRDPMLEQLIHRDRAASKIQAVYRGYTVRKSLNWIREREQKPTKTRPKSKTPIHQRNLFETPPGQLDLRLSDDRFTIGSTFLRAFQRNGAQLVTDTPARLPENVPPKPISAPSYSDDYENPTSTVSSTPRRSKPVAVVTQPSVNIPRTPVQKDQRPIPSSSSSSTLSSSSSTTITPRPTPEPRFNDRRRSISPPLTPTMSPDLGRPIDHLPIPISSALLVNNRPSQYSTDERRYSPNALERQLNAELHLLDGVDASMKQLENMERLRSVTLAQQEVVSLAHILKNRNDSQPMATGSRRKSPVRSVTSSDSSSSTSSRDHHSKKPRPPPSSSESSSEPAVVQREKSRQQNQPDLKFLEDRLKNLENKIRLLNNRAHQIHAEERKAAPLKSSHDSSISEDLPVSHRSSSSTISTVQRKTNDDTSEIRTEIPEKIHEPSSSISFLQTSDVITSDSSDLEQRIKADESALKAKKEQIKKLKQDKKRILHEKEEKIKEKLQKYDDELKKLRTPSSSTKVPGKQSVTIVSRKTPPKVLSDSSTSSNTTPRQTNQSSIVEELPDATSTSQSKSTPLKPIGTSTKKKERDFFDDDDDDEHEEAVKKIIEPVKPIETPRDEHDTLHDALSSSIATDLAASSENENDSRRPSSDLGKPILNFKTDISPSPERSRNSSSSSSSTSSPTKSTPNEKLPSKTKRLSSSSSEQKLSAHGDDYDEDFSDLSHSPSTLKKDPVAPIDVESVQEDLDEKKSSDGTNETSSRKSSDDQQSEILVFGRKSATNTPRKLVDEEQAQVVPPVEEKHQESFLQNDDTSLDVSGSEDENHDELEKEKRIDLIADQFLRTFIDEAIDQGQQIDRIKKQSPSNKKISVAKAAQEWLSDESSSDTDEGAVVRKPISIPIQDERDFPTSNVIELPIEIEQSGFQIDLSRLDEKNTDEPLVPSPRKITLEQPVKLLVPHSSEEVTILCQRALDILFDQNEDFIDRTAIRSEIPEEFFLLNNDNEDEQDEELRISRKAYATMIFDLCLDLIHEISSDRITTVRYPQWQQTKWNSKRFTMAQTPKTRQEIENFVSKTVLELLQLNTRPIVQPKFRVSNHRRAGAERFEAVLDEEIRRTESQWLQYDEDRIQAQFDVADRIFEQLFDEIVAQCVSVIQRRSLPNSSSTRL